MIHIKLGRATALPFCRLSLELKWLRHLYIDVSSGIIRALINYY
ncbi:hypothetical protein VPHD528_0019 [Vibrio phage D528]